MKIKSIASATRADGRMPEDVARIFATYSQPTRTSLTQVRALILDTARNVPKIGAIIETLKWGQPSYLPAKQRVGTTVRIDALKRGPSDFAVFFNCQTDLVSRFREMYGNTLSFEGNRALNFRNTDKIPSSELAHCVALALTYHAVLKGD